MRLFPYCRSDCSSGLDPGRPGMTSGSALSRSDRFWPSDLFRELLVDEFRPVSDFVDQIWRCDIRFESHELIIPRAIGQLSCSIFASNPHVFPLWRIEFIDWIPRFVEFRFDLRFGMLADDRDFSLRVDNNHASFEA